MKRFRHYNKDLAIVLSCFGSVIEEQKYLNLKSFIQKEFSEYDVFIAFQSKMVIKKLAKNGEEFKNLPQVLADVDMLGYKRVVVASINLFPTDEHNLIKSTVEGFKHFSLSNMRVTNAVFTTTKDTTKILHELNRQISKDGVANLFIIHGTPKLDTNGIASIDYTEGFLKRINEFNFFCSLEGAYPFYAMKETLIKELKNKEIKKVQIVPMLLVSGNHFIKDTKEIREELSSDFEVEIVQPVSESEKFNLIEYSFVREVIKKSIDEEIKKLSWE